MDLAERLRQFLIGISSGSDDDDEPVSRCLRCGAEFDRKYRVCPKCGGEFVGIVDGGGDETESGK